MPPQKEIDDVDISNEFICVNLDLDQFFFRQNRQIKHSTLQIILIHLTFRRAQLSIKLILFMCGQIAQ